MKTLSYWQDFISLLAAAFALFWIIVAHARTAAGMPPLKSTPADDRLLVVLVAVFLIAYIALSTVVFFSYP